MNVILTNLTRHTMTTVMLIKIKFKENIVLKVKSVMHDKCKHNNAHVNLVIQICILCKHTHRSTIYIDLVLTMYKTPHIE